MVEIFELGPNCRETYFRGEQFPEFEGFGVVIAGLSSLRGHYRVEHAIDQHAAVITLDGQGLAATEAWQSALKPGDVLCVPATQPFRIRTDAGKPWVTAWAHLEPRRWPRFPAQAELRGGIDPAPLAPLLRLLDGERESHDEVSDALKRALGEAFALLLRRLLHTDGGSSAVRQRAALLQIFDRVRARPGEAWSIERLARLAGCSRSQLHRRCLEVFGRGPAAQVTRLRMDEAGYWLTVTGVPLKVVADRLGYSSPYHFSTAFKRFSGVAPTQYRDGLRSPTPPP